MLGLATMKLRLSGDGLNALRGNRSVYSIAKKSGLSYQTLFKLFNGDKRTIEGVRLDTVSKLLIDGLEMDAGAIPLALSSIIVVTTA